MYTGAAARAARRVPPRLARLAALCHPLRPPRRRRRDRLAARRAPRPRHRRAQAPRAARRSGHALVGRLVRKYWPGAGWYNGTVADDYIDNKGKQRMYSVQFDDGDREDYNFQELNRILIPENIDVLPEGGGGHQGGDDVEGPPNHPDKLNNLLAALSQK